MSRAKLIIITKKYLGLTTIPILEISIFSSYVLMEYTALVR